MKNEAVTGSDGVARTLNEWNVFICDRMIECDGEDPVSLWKQVVKENTITAFASYREGLKNPKHASDMKSSGRGGVDVCIKAAAQSVSEFYKIILHQAIINNETMDEYLLEVSTQIEMLSRMCASKYYKRAKANELGVCILEYMVHHESMPFSRKKLKTFIDDGLSPALQPSSFSIRSIAEHLPWYKLELVCRDNDKG